MKRPCHAAHAPSPETCGICERIATRPEYAALWSDRPPAAQLAPCRHLGAPVPPPPCDCPQKPRAHRCAVHGVCTTDKPAVRRGLTVAAWCEDCKRNGKGYEPVEDTSAAVASAGDVRHLIYHVYPRRGSSWRWNADKLRRRLSLFNGLRLIGVATDDTTEPAAAVRAALPGCEVVEVANDPKLREGTTFLTLMGRVSQFTGPEHATLFGHAKGITSESWADGVRRWTEALYSTCLDHWPAVRRLLTEYPYVGPFKRDGFRFPESQRSSWHFSGSWRWFRNRDIFARDWQDIEKFWCGVEAHPSLTFASHEAAELAFGVPETGLGLYEDRYWQAKATVALADWHEAHLADRWTPLLLTCVLVSHRKPGLVDEAVRSVLAQTSPDWQLVLIDSGDLTGHLRQYEADPRVRVVESPDGARCQGWQINECFRRGLVVGDLACSLTDDDVYLPHAFETWLDRARSHPHEAAWHGQATRLRVADGAEQALGTLDAADGERLNGRIDGIQLCCRREAFRPWPEAEGRETRAHADGLWMDGVQAAATVRRLPVVLARHRHTPLSVFTPA